jgi:hypothetical protein
MGTNRTSEQKCTRCANGDSRTPDGFHLKSTGCYVRCADLPPYEPVVARTSKPKSYIQYVPGHCDRIVWRGSYYMLPLPNAPSPVETPQPAAPTANEISDLSPDSKAQAATSNERLPYNERYSKRLTIQLGDLEALQMALGAADDYLRWLELRGQRHGAVEVVERSVRNARALAYQLRSNADETTRDDAAFEAGWRAAA